MKENTFQASLIRELRELFPGCMILKNDANYMQGIPDLLILYRDHWAALEVKVSASASCRPNQQYYIEHLNNMSFASIIHPGNKEDVLDALQHVFQ